ncbi:MAG: 4-hydroxybenzoate octaprenyltransferase [Phycisphaerales bacterium]
MTSTDLTNEPARASVLGRLFLALADIKLAHSVFALPFAVLAAVMVLPPAEKRGTWDVAIMLGLVVWCMVFARTWAMLVNRVADARLDAANPRTANRAFARGALGRRDGVVLLAVSTFAFVAGAAAFGVVFGNWWPAELAMPVLAWIALYSFTKRFTWWCHVFLGGALAASPLAAAIAVDPGALVHTDAGHAVWWLAAMVLFWVAGFDVIYALQDLEFDRDAGLNSVPARFGWRGAAWVSRGMHAIALGTLAAAWRVEPRFGVIFGVGFGVVAGALVIEHFVLARRGRAGIPMAFFTLNGVVSIALGVAGVADVLA